MRASLVVLMAGGPGHKDHDDETVTYLSSAYVSNLTNCRLIFNLSVVSCRLRKRQVSVVSYKPDLGC